MDLGTPPLLSGSTTRLDCLVEMLDTMLLQHRAPETEAGAVGDTQEASAGTERTPRGADVVGDDPDAPVHGRRPYDGRVGSSGHKLSSFSRRVHAKGWPRAAYETESRPCPGRAALGPTGAPAGDSPPRRQPAAAAARSPGDLSDLSLDSGVSESGDGPAGEPAAPAETAAVFGSHDRRAAEWWPPAAAAGAPGARRRAAEPRPLSGISFASSSSSGAGSLPRPLVRRRPRLDGGGRAPADSAAAAAETDSRLSYLSSSATSVGSPLSSATLFFDAGLTKAGWVVAEIVQTEADYVADLRAVIEGYLLYWLENPEPAITDKHKEALFGSYQDIYRCNSEFLSALEACDLDPLRVAECFVNHRHRFEVYTEYCTQYPRTVSVLKRLLRRETTLGLLRARQAALGHRLPLGSYLLKPVQRILKYHLLLQRMVSCGDAFPESERAAFETALQIMKALAGHINDMKRRHEHAVRVQEVQSMIDHWQGDDLTTFGELLAEETFGVPRTKMPRHVFLFERMLLITKRRDDSSLVYKTHIMCSNLMLIESVPGEAASLQVLPFDDPKQQYTLEARSVELKRQWANRLKAAILESYGADIPAHARELVMKLGQQREHGEGLRRRVGRRHHSVPEYLERRRTVRKSSAGTRERGGEPAAAEPPPDGQDRTQDDGPAGRAADRTNRWSAPMDHPQSEQRLTCHSGPELTALASEDEAAPPPAAGPRLPDVDEEKPADGSSDDGDAPPADEEDLAAIVGQLVMQRKKFQRLSERPRREPRRSPVDCSSSGSPSEPEPDPEPEPDGDSSRRGSADEAPSSPPSEPEPEPDSNCRELEAAAPAGGGPGSPSEQGAAAEVAPSAAVASESPPTEAARPAAAVQCVPGLTIESRGDVQYVSLFDYGGAQSLPAAADGDGDPPTYRRSVSEPCRRVVRRLSQLRAGHDEGRRLLRGLRARSARLSRDLEEWRRGSGAPGPPPERRLGAAVWYCDVTAESDLPGAMRRSAGAAGSPRRRRPLSQLLEPLKCRETPLLVSAVHSASLEHLTPPREAWSRCSGPGLSQPSTERPASRLSAASTRAPPNQKLPLGPLDGSVFWLKRQLSQLLHVHTRAAAANDQLSEQDAVGARLAYGGEPASPLSPLLAVDRRRPAAGRWTGGRPSQGSSSSSGSTNNSSIVSSDRDCDNSGSDFYEVGMDVLEGAGYADDVIW